MGAPPVSLVVLTALVLTTTVPGLTGPTIVSAQRAQLWDTPIQDRATRPNNLDTRLYALNGRLSRMDSRLEGIETAISEMREYLQEQVEAQGQRLALALDIDARVQEDDFPDLPQPRSDYGDLRHNATDEDILEVSQQLWEHDVNRMNNGTDITLNFTEGARFFKTVSQDIQHRATYITMQRLMNLYNPDLTQPETTRDVVHKRELAFMNAVNTTRVTNRLYNFLTLKNMIDPGVVPRQGFATLLREIWFKRYARGKTDPINTCAFEHVFVGEYRNASIDGLHNWVQMYSEEDNDRMTLACGRNRCTLPGVGHNLKVTWSKGGMERKKDGASFFLGSSPEYQIAIFTLCHLYRGNKPRQLCNITTDGTNRVNIRTYKQSKSYSVLTTAFPNFPGTD